MGPVAEPVRSSELWGFFWSFFRPLRWMVVWVTLLALAQALTLVPIAFLVKEILDRYIPEADSSSVVLAGVSIFLLHTVYTLLALWNRHLTLQGSKRLMVRLREELVSRLLERPRSYFSRIDQGQVHSAIVQDSERLDVMVNALVNYLFPSTLISLGLLAVLVTLSPWLTLILFVVAPLVFLTGRLIGRSLRRRVRLFNEAFEKFSDGIQFLLDGFELIRTFAAEDEERRSKGAFVESLRSSSASMAWLQTAYELVQNLLITGSGILVLVVGGSAVIGGRLSLGQLVSFYVALALLKDQVRQALKGIPQVIVGNESLRQLHRFSQDEDIQPYRGDRKIGVDGGIELESIEFGYGDVPLLRGIDLRLAPGSFTMLSGPSGSGKSTLINLMLGFYRPQQGRILVSGVALDELDLRYFRSQVGVVPQEPLLFPGTIAENIAYGCPEATRETAVRAARLSLAEEFILPLENGLDAAIGEHGILLSGGQRQRLALARALVRKPKILILDEATNNLDRELSVRLIQGVRAALPDMTILFVTHDSELYGLSDECFELRNGKLCRLDSPSAND